MGRNLGFVLLGILLAAGVGAVAACGANLPLSADAATTPNAPVTSSPVPIPTVAPSIAPDVGPYAGKWTLWTGGTRLRGANIWQRRVYPELDGAEFLGPGPVGPPFTQQDFQRLAAMGANYVNISHPGLFTESPPYVIDLDVQANLDTLLDMIAQADMFAVISFRSGPGRSPFTFYWDEVGDWFDESYLNDSMWQDAAAQDAWAEMWRYTAERYRGNPIVVGYDLMVEPNSNEVGSDARNPLDIWEPDVFYGQYAGSLYDWNQLVPRITTAIRQVDADTPILIGGNGYSGVEWLPYLAPTGDPRTVYVVHQYAPHQYTHQWWEEVDCSYPGTCDLDWDGQRDDPLDRAWLEGLHGQIDAYVAGHGVPVAANEFGVVRWAPGAAAFMADQLDLFEKRGMNHALWSWDPAWEPWTEEVNAFTFRHGPDPGNHSDVQSSDLLDVIQANWARNRIRPSSAFTTTAYLPAVGTAISSELEPLSLAEVRFWAYQLQGIAEAGEADALVDSDYDLLVLEPTRTDWSSDDRNFDTAGLVSRLKASNAHDGERNKLVLAYIDIGEAEDWRWYWTWSTDWDCVLPTPSDWPDYILECDPDGWTGNYPVAYWDEAWKDIIIYGRNQGEQPGRDYSSAIDEAIKDGFDGIYLDWVEGWENTAVTAAAQQAGLDPAAEMIAFIGEMRAYAAARRPGFLIVQQNAAELIDGRPELLDVIDAIAQEAIWYDGDATDEWNDPDGHDWLNDKDLTDYYLEFLAPYQAAGLPVFNCEYALAEAEKAYGNSYQEGFVPYVSRRSLGRLSTTPPPGY